MTASITIRQVINPTPEEQEAICQIATTSFRDDMFIKCCVGGDLTLVPALQRALIGAQQVGGENWVACDGDKIVAFAGWFGPGQALLNSPEQIAAGWDKFAEKMPPELNDWWMTDFLPAYAQQTDAALGPGAKLNGWHLQLIATLPEYRRRGIATALIKHKEKFIAAEGGQLMCLEAENVANVEFYKRLGWEEKGNKHYTTPYGPGEFDMWVLAKVSAA